VEDPVLIRSLRNALQETLPGNEYQYKMANLDRRIALKSGIPASARHAAVLLLLYQRNTSWETVFIRRKSIAGDVHGGQISLPGGRMHRGETVEEAALRESSEEIGSRASAITILGHLTQLYIPVSNHLVFPVVGYQHEYTGWTPQQQEVDFILETPIDFLQAPESRVTREITIHDGLLLHNVPCFDVEGHLIWGATAMILSEFSGVMEKISMP
jgi:8-oxo-dGTP pyrophosphatase MutT (NUDIX family)